MSTVNDARLAVPLRNLKVETLRGEGPVQKLNPAAGAVLEEARANIGLEPKAMAIDLALSHSLVLRGLKSQGDLGFHRLWELSDDFWLALIIAIARKRGLALVRTTIEIPQRRQA